MEQYVSLRRKGRNNRFTRFIKSNYVGWLFNLPLILGLIIFTAVPMCLSLFYSFNDTFVEATGVTTIWCGLRNYISIFEDDEKHRYFHLYQRSFEYRSLLFLGITC